MFLAALGAAGLMGLAVIGASIDASIGTGERALAIVSVVVPGLLFVWFAYLGIRMANPGHPHIRLDATEMVIEHKALFRHPMRIARSNVEAVDVDVGTEGSLRPRDRFGIAREEHEEHADLPAWLYGRHGSPVPVIGHFRELPNVALILHEPVRFRGIRRVSRPLFRHTVRSPIRTKEVRGFTFAAQRPFIAEQCFRAWGIPVRDITTEDVVALRPGPRDIRRQTYRTIATIVVGLLVFGGPVLAYLLTERSGSDACEGLRSSTAVRLSRGAGTDDAIEVDELSDVLLDAPSGWVPVDSFDLDDTNVAVRFGSGWGPAFVAHDLERGYTRHWSSGAIHLYAHVFEFSERNDAIAMHDAFLASSCPTAVDARRVVGVPGSTAVEYTSAETTYENALFTIGPRLYLVALEEHAGTPTMEQLERFTRLAHDVAR
jgi:hypothetical protein